MNAHNMKGKLRCYDSMGHCLFCWIFLCCFHFSYSMTAPQRVYHATAALREQNDPRQRRKTSLINGSTKARTGIKRNLIALLLKGFDVVNVFACSITISSRWMLFRWAFIS